VTTICYRDGILAADSLITMGDTKVHGHMRKISRVHGFMIGLSGGAADCSEFLMWCKAGGDNTDHPPPKGTYSALVVDEKGKVLEIENGKYLPKFSKAKFHAIGSGGPYALAAMYAGASATEAVKIAAKIDTATGLPVKTLKLKG
jgi:ATP-dependent protease HslVU (ClpYQ) peptidase subunit